MYNLCYGIIINLKLLLFIQLSKIVINVLRHLHTMYLAIDLQSIVLRTFIRLSLKEVMYRIHWPTFHRGE